MSQINRRQFVVAAAGAAVCGCLAGCASEANAPWTGPTHFELGAADQLKEGIDGRWAKSGGFFMVREEGKIYAVSAICSHRACALEAKEPEYLCPCHGSRFNRQGKVLVGPAITSLVRFGISTTPSGGIAIDRTKTFDETHWNEPGAYLKV